MIGPYWQKTLKLFLGLKVLVVLADGRRQAGVLSGKGGEYRVLTDQGPATVPVSSLASVEVIA